MVGASSVISGKMSLLPAAGGHSAAQPLRWKRACRNLPALYSAKLADKQLFIVSDAGHRPGLWLAPPCRIYEFV